MAKSKRRRNYGKLIIKGMLILSIFYVTSTFYDQYKELNYLNTREEALSREFETVQNYVNSLKDQIENSNKDEHIEKIAREHLKMVKKGEMIFIDLGKPVN